MDDSTMDIIFFGLFMFLNLLQTFLLTIFILKIRKSKSNISSMHVMSVKNDYQLVNKQVKVEEEEVYEEIVVKTGPTADSKDIIHDETYEAPLEGPDAVYDEVNTKKITQDESSVDYETVLDEKSNMLPVY